MPKEVRLALCKLDGMLCSHGWLFVPVRQMKPNPAHPKDPIIRNWGLVPELVLFGSIEHEHENQP